MGKCDIRQCLLRGARSLSYNISLAWSWVIACLLRRATSLLYNTSLAWSYYLIPPPLKDILHIVQQRWALQQKVAKAIADKRCSVAGLLPVKTQVKASCQEAHRLRAGKHFSPVDHSMQRVAKRLPVDVAEVAHMEEVTEDDADSDASDIVCANCLSGETTKDNDIQVCDGDHSKFVGYHQKCCEPPVINIPDHSWFCPECAIQRSGVDSRLQDSDYAPSVHAASSSATSTSTSTSSSSTDSDSDSPSSDSTSDGSSSGSDVSDSSDDSSDS